MKELKLLSLVLVAGTATMFTACTSESDNSPSANISYESVAAAQQTPVTFGTYMGEQAITRAGSAGVMDITKLQSTGFGVFAYYTNGTGYASTTKPNFMYNQAVTYSSGWSYTPIKYWPNETVGGDGVVDQNNAKSSGGPDKVSFFAYAPYTSSVTFGGDSYVFDPATGSFKYTTLFYPSPATGAESGITKFSANNVTGDPLVYYTVTESNDPSNIVDLVWGVSPGSNYTIAQSATPQAVTNGFPNIDLTKQTVGEKIDFKFLHALAKMTFTVQGIFDEVASGSNAKDANTKIVVDNVAITTASFHKNGILNLNNTSTGADTPNWSMDGATLIGARSIGNGDIPSTLAYVAPASGNPVLASQPAGVTTSKQNLMDGGKYFTFIPETGDLTITITYHVFTEDSNLADGYSWVTNVIKKQITGLALAGNTAYTINLQLGMTTVKVNATAVSGWGDGGEVGAVDLPINVN